MVKAKVKTKEKRQGQGTTESAASDHPATSGQDSAPAGANDPGEPPAAEAAEAAEPDPDTSDSDEDEAAVDGDLPGDSATIMMEK